MRAKHEPIISKELFDRVQAVLERKTHRMKPAWQPQPLARLFRCGSCGMSVTAEIQKGHTYYRCIQDFEIEEGQVHAALRPG